MTIESSSPNLRPLRMGELLDRIVRLYRQNFLTFIGIVALVQVPLSIIQLLVTLSTISTLTQFSTTTTSDFGLLTQATNGSFANLIPTILGFILVQGVGTAALTRAVANNYMGQKTGVVESYQQIGKVWVSLIGALIFAGLFGVVLLIWWIIPCIGWITGIGALIFYGWVIVPLIAPVIVLERQGASGAIQRIWSLVRHRFWWVFGFAFLLLVFNYLLIAGPTAVVSLIFQFGIGDPLSPTNDQLVLQSVVQTVVNFIFSLLYLPLQLTGFTLLYFDLRVRTEGFDLAVLASESGVGGSFDAVGTIETAPKGDSKFGVTWTELGYFAVISIGFAVLYFGLVAVILGVAGGIGGAF